MSAEEAVCVVLVISQNLIGRDTYPTHSRMRRIDGVCGIMCAVLLVLAVVCVQVNQVLPIKFKSYVRIVGCFPEKVMQSDFIECIPELQYSEKVREGALLKKTKTNSI